MPPPAGRHTLPRSFACAWSGLAETALRERNLRIHLAAGVLAGAFAARAPLAPAERALVVLCMAAVISAEAANSALEAAVDLASPGWSERARVAKDAAAGAVLALAGGTVLVLATVALPRLGALAAAAPAHALAALGALAAAAATLLLPAPSRRRPAADVALAVVALGGIFLVARGAASAPALASSAACLLVAAAAAARRRRTVAVRPGPREARRAGSDAG